MVILRLRVRRLLRLQFRVADAHALARKAHAGQVDLEGGDYYDAHLAPIAEAARPFGPLAEIAAVLHDIVEDTRSKANAKERFDLDRLRSLGVPEFAVEAIDAVTRRPDEPYRALIVRSAAHSLGRLVKLLDNAHNLARNAYLALIDPKKAKSMKEKRYEPARQVLLEAEAAAERRILS